ncbi:MAG: DNA repair protein RecO [Pseudanabaenaceae cyanobacterium]|jgi:DNA repair protein RecO (recombination protein O)
MGEYQVTGINLRGMPLGEQDRLLTVLTRERGLLQLVATGARKHRSPIAGLSGLFVVNDLIVAEGKSIDRIKQAQMVSSFVGLGQNLAKLTAAQYLAELSLVQALNNHPQEELFLLLLEHLQRIENCGMVQGKTTAKSSNGQAEILASLVQGVFHLLAIAGFAPQVHQCCLTHHPLPQVNVHEPIPKALGKIAFSVSSGGTIHEMPLDMPLKMPLGHHPDGSRSYGAKSYQGGIYKVEHYLTSTELSALQSLPEPELPANVLAMPLGTWLVIEGLLRQYAQYHFGKAIQSATLIDSCFRL